MTRYLYMFTVSGSSPFPIDMLRYDRCWPESESDSGSISATARNRPHGARFVTLTGHHPPTDGRWASFGWTVHPDVQRRAS